MRIHLKTLLDQIGLGNVLAISGGRRERMSDDTIRFPVAYGYDVRVTLQPNDTYKVSRFYRGMPKGSVTDLYCDQVGEYAYRASCYHDPFGD